MNLIKPNKKLEASYCSYLTELGNEERYPFTLDLEHENFEELIELLDEYEQGRSLPDKAVANSTLWLVEDEEVVGVTNIRHYLNVHIEKCGGHIGLSIRPSRRGQGLGTKLMRMSVELLKSKGVRTTHIHCYKSNASSARAIIKVGGKLDSELLLDDKVIQRYLINN